MQLLYGEHLRRSRGTADSRAQLAAALETFERLGAAPLAAAAGVEVTVMVQTVTVAQETPEMLAVAAGSSLSPASSAGLT